jgi:hypothetical protein
MTAEQIANYERAAVALESHIIFSNIEPRSASDVAVAAYDMCNEPPAKTPSAVYVVDLRASRLLRDCIARNREL